MPGEQPITPSKLRPNATPFVMPEESPLKASDRVRLTIDPQEVQESPSKLRGSAAWFVPQGPWVAGPRLPRPSGSPLSALTPGVNYGGMLPSGLVMPSPDTDEQEDAGVAALPSSEASPSYPASSDSDQIARPAPVRAWTDVKDWMERVPTPINDDAVKGFSDTIYPGQRPDPAASPDILSQARLSQIGTTRSINPSDQFVYEPGHPVSITNIDPQLDLASVEYRVRELSEPARVLRFEYTTNPAGRSIMTATFAIREEASSVGKILAGQTFGGSSTAVVLQFPGNETDWGF